jgi:hypothetical protein
VIENDPEWATKALAYIQKYKDEWWAEMTLKFSRKV